MQGTQGRKTSTQLIINLGSIFVSISSLVARAYHMLSSLPTKLCLILKEGSKVSAFIHSHFMKEKTDFQREEITGPRSCSQE